MYTDATADHFHNPRHVGVLTGADAIGQAGKPGQGPYMVLYVKVQDDRIADVSFQTYGCPAAIACGSWVSENALNRTLEEAAALETADLDRGLGGLPLGKEHCPKLAISALRAAIAKLADGKS